MAKLRDNPINKDDINEYLLKSSDFAFEIIVLRSLTSLGFICEHAGTYEDPVTKKTREFDIRARKFLINEPDLKLILSLSIECKNLKNNFPLMIHCMPRGESESYLDLVWASEPNFSIAPYENAKRVTLTGDASPYQMLDPVGKSCVQVGRRATQDGEIVGNDAEVFDKISQAVNSAYDLIKEAHYAAEKKVDVVTMVIPVLIVPKDRIWTVWYKRTGDVEKEPFIEDNVEYFLGKEWVVGEKGQEFRQRYYLSHLEIVQIEKIPEMILKFTRLPITNSSKNLKMKIIEVLRY